MPMKATAATRERFHRGALLGLVDEVADDLRQGELEPQADEEQNAQGCDERKLRAHVSAEEAAELPRLDLDGRLSERGG